MIEHAPINLSPFEQPSVRQKHIYARKLLLNKGRVKRAHDALDKIAAIQGSQEDLEFRTLYATSEVAVGSFTHFDPHSALPHRKKRLYKSVTERIDDLDEFVATLLEASQAISINDTSFLRIKENRDALSHIGNFLQLKLPDELTSPSLESIRRSRIAEALQYSDYPLDQLQKDLAILCQNAPWKQPFTSRLYSVVRDRLNM